MNAKKNLFWQEHPPVAEVIGQPFFVDGVIRRWVCDGSARWLFAGVVVVLFLGSVGAAARAGETLYNGIVLPDVWPPRRDTLTRDVLPVPYLQNPPAVIPINVGRQLLVDNFLIENSGTLTRTAHPAKFHPNSPVLFPEAKNSWEVGTEAPTAMTCSDGVWYDPQDKLFKMWYWAGRFPSYTSYATSTDGINWEKPLFNAGTNIVSTADSDSSTIWLDQNETNPDRRYKMLLHLMYPSLQTKIYASPDGINWSAPLKTLGPGGDRNTMFYNPFRKVWVNSISENIEPETGGVGRSRRYWETKDIIADPTWTTDEEPTMWVAGDELDNPGGFPSELYTLDAAPYESLMLGMFSMMQNELPKSNDLYIGYSRDGFNWARPDRSPLISRSPTQGDWNWDYLQPAGGVGLVVGDELYFYVGARSDNWTTPGAYRSTGLAILRRDGFVSWDAGDTEGSLITRSISFSGKYLFVNADVDGGQLWVEVLDEQGNVIGPFSRANCNSVSADKTLQQITWEGVDDLSDLIGEAVRFRFTLENGSLYAFWVSPDLSGASYGYVAAGGPGFTGPIDTVGMNVPGDFDGDGDVDGADFVAWQTNFPTAEGATLADGDADGDGDVDGADFVIWQTNFPFSPSSEAATIPEPDAAWLLATGALLALTLARQLPMTLRTRQTAAG